MTGEEQPKFEIGDEETFVSGKDAQYSRSSSIMRMTNKCQDDLSREMKPGFFEYKQDKFGNTSKTFTDDTRKSACSSVITLRNTMQCDFDDKIKEELKTLDKEISDGYVKFLDLEEEEWDSYNPGVQHNLTTRGLGFVKSRFNRDKHFGEMFLDFKLKKHRLIFESLIRLQKRMDFYKGETFET